MQVAELFPGATKPPTSTSIYFTSWHTVLYEIAPISTTFCQISAISNSFSGHYRQQNYKKLEIHCFFDDWLALMNINPASSVLYWSPIIIKWTLTSERNSRLEEKSQGHTVTSPPRTHQNDSPLFIFL